MRGSTVLANRQTLSDPVASLGGIGVRLGEKLARIGIEKIRDLLFHLPYRYLDRTRLTPIGALRPGHEACIQGEIESTEVRYGRRRSLLCRISDRSGALLLRFFYFSKAQQQALQKGAALRCYGQVRAGPSALEIVHPEYRRLRGDDEALEARLTPVYPATEGLAQPRLRKLTEQALALLREDTAGLSELLPGPLLAALKLPALADALVYVHRPPPDAAVAALQNGRHPAQKRLAFEELLAHQLSLLNLRRELRAQPAPALARDNALIARYLNSLPFSLTGAQRKAWGALAADLAGAKPMLRLVQGDVGSGKTVVAALAALQAIGAGYAVALMAPTELLAEQHVASFSRWFGPLNIEALSLTGKLKKSAREAARQRLLGETPFIVIGTHALFQESIRFRRLGLVIIDEQHRFGVRQRLALLEKARERGQYPHQLIMTATPIPRTLTMTAYADLDHTIIDELPPGRRPVTTSVISNERRDEIIARIRRACRSGRQVYWVCTLIEESETRQCETAMDTAARLKEKLPGLSLELIHGRLKPAEKDRVMQAFKAGKVELLVATTVIEVGLDVPNASLMIIDNAERLGLAQLHQLRGRIGRGKIGSDCVLMYQAPLGDLARERLAIMRASNNGFVIAEKDLALRGPGEVLGAQQSGLPNLRVADLARDAALLPDVRKTANRLMRQQPETAALLVRRWLGRPDYGNV